MVIKNSALLRSGINQKKFHSFYVWVGHAEKSQRDELQKLFNPKEKYLIRISIRNDYKQVYVEPNSVVANQNLFIEFSAWNQKLLLLLKNACIIFQNNEAIIKIYDGYEQFVAVKPDDKKDMLSKAKKQIKLIQKRIKQIKRSEVLGLLPDEIVEKQELINELLIYKFLVYHKLNRKDSSE